MSALCGSATHMLRPSLPSFRASGGLRSGHQPALCQRFRVAAKRGQAPLVRAFGGTFESSGDVKGAMLAPSLSNKGWVRAAAVAAAVAAAARSTAFLPAQGLAFVHLAVYGTWLGAIVWTTFIAGITMFRSLPRQVFGRLQSKLFPLYFGLSAACAAVLLGTLHAAAGAGAPPPAREVQLLAAGLAGSLANLFWVEPKATGLMFERYALENAEGAPDKDAIARLYKQFGKWHGVSSLFNLAVLVVAVGHGWFLGARLALGA